MVVAQIQHGGNIARVAVFKRHHAVGGVAPLHGVKHFVPGGAADGLGMGEERFERDVGKGPLHALIGGAVAAQHRGLVLLGNVHHVLDMVPVVGAQGRLLNAGGGFVQHHRLPRGVKDGQAVGLFVRGNGQHRGHPALKQRRQLRVHRVDLRACFVQCVHGESTSFVL